MSAPSEHKTSPSEEDKNNIILTAAAKGAGLALVAGGLVAMTGARYSPTYKALTRPMKAFLLGSGTSWFFSQLPLLLLLLLLLQFL